MLGSHSISYNESHKRLEYRLRDAGEKLGVMQDNCLKLFCSEVSFLSGVSKQDDIVVYVGNGSAHQVPLLCIMFPWLKFDVFNVRPKETNTMWERLDAESCNIIKRRFDIQDGKAYRRLGHRVLFISDAKSVTKDNDTNKSIRIKPENVLFDMERQKRVLYTMRPREAFLRFMPPFHVDGNSFEYLDGEMYIQPFSHRSSTEVRLHVTRDDTSYRPYQNRSYDCKAHEQVLFYHNHVKRRQHLEKPDQSLGRLCLNHDQCAAHEIIGKWAERAMAEDSMSSDRIDSIVMDIDGTFGKMLGLKNSVMFGLTVRRLSGGLIDKRHIDMFNGSKDNIAGAF